MILSEEQKKAKEKAGKEGIAEMQKIVNLLGSGREYLSSREKVLEALYPENFPSKKENSDTQQAATQVA